MSQMYALICVVSIFYSRNVLFTGGVLYWWGLHGYMWKQFCRYQGDVPICWTFLYKLCYLVEGTLFFCSSFHPSSFFTIFYICFLCSSSSSSSFPILNSLSFLQNLLFLPTLFGLFFYIFVGDMSISGATHNPVSEFWVSKPGWAALFTLVRGVCDIHSLRFTSGVTPLLVYMASIAACCFPTCMFQQR